jgi:ElaB/YqjD/DUF883 family membrane-anchored ribosome-binding protein
MFSNITKDEANKLKNASQNTAHQLNNDLHVAANQAGRKMRNIFNSASDELSQASDIVTAKIRNNPLRSSMIALGAGIVLGVLLRR